MDNEYYNEEENRRREIEGFKQQFRKEPEDNTKEKKMNFMQEKGFLPYMYSFLAFIATVIVLFLIFDKMIMPSMVHNRELVLVPDITGQPSDAAEDILKGKKLRSEITAQQYSEKFKEGIIVNQTPKPKTEVKSGRPVFLTVSKGKEKVTVPYLLGLSLRDAKINLLEHGLVLGDVSYKHSEAFPKDTIMKQSVKSGKMIPFGSQVSLVVSKGSENQVAVPVLIGRRIEEVESILQEKNLKLGNVSYKESDTFLPNTIIETFPSQNSLVQEGTSINIVVSN